MDEQQATMEFDVRTTFVSFVDHLPSDVIRKLWLIQSLNLRHDALRQQLDSQLKDLKRTPPDDGSYTTLVHAITALSHEALKIRREVLEESKSIATTIKIAKLQLQGQSEQLQHDQKMYQNELEMKEVLIKHSKRSNKRTKPQQKSPPIKLKLNMKKSSSPKKRSRAKPIKKEVSEHEVTHDEDGEIYCLCRGPSFGEMVACDNDKCKYEWFHYSCVGLTRAPRGQWLCPMCSKKK